MEYMSGGALKDVISFHAEFPLTEQQIRWIVWNVLNGLHYLHSLHRIHRDIKSDNILLSKQGHVKIGAFALLCAVQSPRSYHPAR